MNKTEERSIVKKKKMFLNSDSPILGWLRHSAHQQVQPWPSGSCREGQNVDGTPHARATEPDRRRSDRRCRTGRTIRSAPWVIWFRTMAVWEEQSGMEGQKHQSDFSRDTVAELPRQRYTEQFQAPGRCGILHKTASGSLTESSKQTSS